MQPLQVSLVIRLLQYYLNNAIWGYILDLSGSTNAEFGSLVLVLLPGCIYQGAHDGNALMFILQVAWLEFVL